MSNEDIFPLEYLGRVWADKTVSKDPPRYSGDTCVGLKYSECSADYLKELASFTQWKVNKEMEKESKGEKPKLQTRGKDAGKPWYVKDAFEAKLIRTWHASKMRGSVKVAGHQATVDEGTDQDEIPF